MEQKNKNLLRTILVAVAAAVAGAGVNDSMHGEPVEPQPCQVCAERDAGQESAPDIEAGMARQIKDLQGAVEKWKSKYDRLREGIAQAHEKYGIDYDIPELDMGGE